MTTFAEVKLTAEHYGPDVQFRMQCPFCSNKERSFAATMRPTGEIAYICHRASCGTRGYIPSTPGMIAEKAESGPKKGDHIELNLRNLTDKEKTLISSRWSTDFTPNWKWDVNSDRLAMSVHGPDGNIRGFVLRDLTDYKTPKVLTVKMVQGP